jgi:protein-disulfide isomerase
MTNFGSESGAGRGNSGWLFIAAGALLLAGAVAGWLFGTFGPGSDRAQVEQIVREYILANPEILPEAMQNLQRKEAAKQLTGIRGDVEKPFRGAVLGNPEGKTTLVEFTDFACGYCRQSVDDIKALLASDPDLKIVIRELPILSPASVEAARMALAAADQGKYEAFHDAMFAAGRPGPETIEAAAREAGLDLVRARAFAKSPIVDEELERNLDVARQLGFNGTPSWVVGDELLTGAVGTDRLSEAIADARS